MKSKELQETAEIIKKTIDVLHMFKDQSNQSKLLAAQIINSWAENSTEKDSKILKIIAESLK